MHHYDHIERDWLDFTADLLSKPLTAPPRERIATLLIDTFSSAGCAFTSFNTTRADLICGRRRFTGRPVIVHREYTDDYSAKQYVRHAEWRPISCS